MTKMTAMSLPKALVTLGIVSLPVLSTLSAQKTKATPPVGKRNIKATTVTSDDKIAKQVFSNQPFDLVADTLPANFRGVDLKRMIQNLTSSEPMKPKSEFESSTAYSARKASIEHLQIFPTLSADSTFAVVLPEPDDLVSKAYDLVYDADTETFEFSVKALNRKLYLVPDQPTLVEVPIVSEILSRRSYEASNALGAHVTVKEISSESYEVGLAPDSWLVKERLGTSNIPLRVKVPSADAPSLKSALRIAFVGKLIAPWVADDVIGSEATISNPYEFTEGKKVAAFDLQHVLIFDNNDGRILADFSRTNIEKARALRLNLSIPCNSGLLEITVDGKRDYSSCTGTRMVRANDSIVLKTYNERFTQSVLELNGASFTPAWSKQGIAFFMSATATVTP